jgi:hypothetical protein
MNTEGIILIVITVVVIVVGVWCLVSVNKEYREKKLVLTDKVLDKLNSAKKEDIKELLKDVHNEALIRFLLELNK